MRLPALTCAYLIASQRRQIIFRGQSYGTLSNVDILRSMGDFLTSPAEQLVEPAASGTARLLAGCLIVMTFVFACLDAGLMFTRADYVPPWEGYALLTLSYALSRTVWYRWGALAATLMFPMVALMQVVMGTADNYGVLAYAVLAPFFAGLFLGVRASALLAVFVPVVIVAVGSTSQQGVGSILDPLVASVLGGMLAVAYSSRRSWVERKRVENVRLHEAQILQMQKMEALGRMAGGIAHDFNNLLTVISGGVELLARNGQAKELKLIDSATRSAQELTSQLQTLSRQGVVDHSTTDLRRVLAGVHQLLFRILGEDIEILVDCDAALHPVGLGEGQLQQVLLNLATNARDAMPKGGRLEFIAKNQGQEEIRLTVRDSGEGMDPLVAQRIFEPFFTTKSVGKGTGLGMSMVFGLISQAGGKIDVESAVGRGTALHITLRRAEQGLEAPPLSERRLDLRGSAKGRLLLVEDDSGVRELCRSVLRREGYDVIEAADPHEALELFEKQGEGVDLVLSDIVMPHMTGLELAERLRAQCDDLPVLFMSGYAPEEVVGEPVDARELLRKPFRPTELLRRVSALLYGLESQAPPARRSLADIQVGDLSSSPRPTEPSPEFESSPEPVSAPVSSSPAESGVRDGKNAASAPAETPLAKQNK